MTDDDPPSPSDSPPPREGDFEPEADLPVVEAATEPLRQPSEQELRELVELAFAASSNWHLVPNRFHSLARSNGLDAEHETAWPVRYALAYFLESERSPREQVMLRSRDLGDGRRHPPPPREAGDAVHEAWRKLLDEVRLPALRARLLDLLVQVGGAGNPDRAAAAMNAYIDHVTAAPVRIPTDEGEVDVMWRDHDLDHSVGRAVSLAHIARSSAAGPDATRRAVGAAFDRIELAMQSTASVPSRAMLLIGVVSASRAALTAEEKRRLLDVAILAIEVYKEQDNVVDELATVVITLDPPRREAMNRRRIQCRLDLAASRPASAKMVFLEEAARLASDLHLADMADDAIRQLQRAAREDQGLKSISASVVIPGEIIDAYVRELSFGVDWREALRSWLGGRPPSGDLAANTATARRLVAGSFRSVFPSVRLGADYLPRWHAVTNDDHIADELNRTEQFAMGMASRNLADALDRIAAQHGVPPLDDLALFLSFNGKGDYDLAMALAKSFHRYWRSDFEGCVHTATLRIEAAARALVLLLDAPAYSVARTNNPGKYIGLDALLDVLLEHGLDPNWDRFIRTLFLGPVGGNLRHDVAHGFGEVDPPRETAALALRALALLVVLLWEPNQPLGTPPAPPTRSPTVTAIGGLITALSTAKESPAAARRVIRDEVDAAYRAMQAAARRLRQLVSTRTENK